MKGDFKQLTRCTIVLYVVAFILFIFVAVAIRTYAGFTVVLILAVCAGLCLGLACLISAFINDMRECIAEKERYIKECRNYIVEKLMEQIDQS